MSNHGEVLHPSLSKRNHVPLITSASFREVRWHRRWRGGIGEAYLPRGCSLYKRGYSGRIVRRHDVGKSSRIKLMIAWEVSVGERR